MKKFKSVVLILLCVCSLMGCGTKEYKVKSWILNDVDEYNFYMSSVIGITLSPRMDDYKNKNLRYHWKVDNKIEKFYYGDVVGSSLSICKGEPVLLNLGLDDGEEIKKDSKKVARTIKVTLEIEDTSLEEIISKSEIVIEDYYGTYKVKR